MSSQDIFITPDPAILQVLTYLEMKPIDSLCELIDNSIDAILGAASELSPLIIVELPTKKEVEEGTARVRVRDNGPGMTVEQLGKSLQAGYTSKAKHGNLGLFGVGFNIGTGKLGRTTRVITARKEDNFATETIMDLVAIRKTKSFKLKTEQIQKPEGFANGTIVEVTNPWGRGNQNFEFMLKLANLGRPKTLQLLGRVYATILQKKQVRIVIGEDNVDPFHHCIWDDSRSVEHQVVGKVPAVHRFKNKVIHSYVKCVECDAVIPTGQKICPEAACGSSSIQTVEEKISGWVGIQRYLDASHYGLDLIRNGRAIRQLEKEPFFTFQDLEMGGDPIFDYPIDNRDGRIVGEIHLDQVPVDPAKQNFERSSPEWRRAIEFLRGRSSLQPNKPGAEHNTSEIYKLYQAYRKVRTPGTRSMTMGKWPPGSNEAKALSKQEVDDLRKKFDAQEPGYFDDAEWFRLVEQADRKPVAGLIQCPACFIESPETAEDCSGCGHIFQGKNCINKDCGILIALSSVQCPHCGQSQIPHIEEPWSCAVCGNANASDDTVCSICSHARGALNPVSKESLKAQGHMDESLSTDALIIKLASGDSSSPINVTTYFTNSPIYTYHNDGNKVRLPSVRFVDNEIEIFIDPEHPYFQQAGVTPVQQVSAEVAFYLHQYHGNQATKFPAEHTLTKLSYDILNKVWPEKLSTSEVEDDLEALFTAIRTRLAKAAKDESADIYSNLPQDEKTALVSELVRIGRDVSELSEMKDNGQFIHFVRPQAILSIYRQNPKLFFDGNVWTITYNNIPNLDTTGVTKVQNQIRSEHGCLLEIAALYAEKGAENPREAELARSAIKLLLGRLGE